MKKYYDKNSSSFIRNTNVSGHSEHRPESGWGSAGLFGYVIYLGRICGAGVVFLSLVKKEKNADETGNL